MTDEILMTVTEVAERLRVHQDWVRHQIRDGHLAAVRIGREWRIEPAVLRLFVADRK